MKNSIAIATVTILLTAIHAFAVYAPNEGRWLSRDPIEEKGGLNLYAFCENDSVNKTDRLGMQSHCSVDLSGMMSCTTAPKCCNGVEYNPLTHCCVKDKIVSKEKKATGIKRCCAYQDPVFTVKSFDLYVPLHCWVEYPGGARGLYPSGMKDEPEGYYGIQNTAPSPGQPYKVCTELIASECDYDLDEVSSCMKNSGNIIPWIVGTHDCRQWAVNTYTKCVLKGLRK
jgi:RHS repeat-associated core domain